MINEYGKGAAVEIDSVFRPVYHVERAMGHLKRDFLDIYLTTFLGSVISEIDKLWESSFFENIQNLMQIWKMHTKIPKKFFVFSTNASELFRLNCLY